MLWAVSLTKHDLLAIKQIVDDAIEVSMQQTAAGFAEVHAKLDQMGGRLDHVETNMRGVKTDLSNVKDTVARIELQQRAMVNHEDEHDIRLNRLEKHTGLLPA